MIYTSPVVNADQQASHGHSYSITQCCWGSLYGWLWEGGSNNLHSLL